MFINSSTKSYQDTKERLHNKAGDRDIKAILKKKKKKKQQHGRKRYKNLSEDEKQNLFDFRKIYFKMRKNALL